MKKGLDSIQETIFNMQIEDSLEREATLSLQRPWQKNWVCHKELLLQVFYNNDKREAHLHAS